MFFLGLALNGASELDQRHKLHPHVIGLLLADLPPKAPLIQNLKLFDLFSR